MFRDSFWNFLNWLGIEQSESANPDRDESRPGLTETNRSARDARPIDRRLSLFIQLVVDLPAIMIVFRTIVNFFG